MAKGDRGGKRTSGKAAGRPIKQKPTNARYIEDMNEAQLDREIAKYERRTNSAQKKIDGIRGSASVKNAERIFEMFPGGVGGSAVNQAYRNKMERYGSALTKIGDIQTNLKYDQAHLDALRAAKKTVNGTGKSLNEYRKDKVSAGGKLGAKWTKSTEKTGYGLFGDSPMPVHRNGTYSIMKPHSYAYTLFNNGKKVGDFKTLKAAKDAAQGGSTRKK